MKTQGIVLHRAEVFTATDYHFVIERNGRVKANLPVDEKGEHAIFYNGVTVAIAIFGDFASDEPGKNSKPTAPQIVACVSLMQSLNKKYGGGLWAAGHTQLGPKGTNVPAKLLLGHTCPGENFPLAEVLLKSGCKVFPMV